MKGQILNVDVQQDMHQINTFGGETRHMAGRREFTLSVRLIDPTQEELTSLHDVLMDRPVIDFNIVPNVPVVPPSVAPDNAHNSGSNPVAGSW